MKKTMTTVAVASLLAGATSVAQAEISGNVALTTDYVWRGVSQSDEDPAIQGGLDWAHDSGFYVGVWGSSVDFDEGVADPADMEFDIYAGYGGEFGNGMGYDVSIIRYIYPGTDVDLDWTEVGGSLSFGMFSVGAAYSNDVFATDESGLYLWAGVDYEFEQGFVVSAAVGRYDFDDDVVGAGSPDSYVDWRLAVGTEYAGLGFELAYTDTDSDGEELFGDWADSRLVFTVSKEL